MKAKGKSNRDNQAKGWGVPSRRITVICACLLAWNILFPVSWFLEAEAIAVNRASAKYQHVASTDNEEYRRLMHEEMDAAHQRGSHYFYALAILAGVNIVGLAVIAFWPPKSQPATGP